MIFSVLWVADRLKQVATSQQLIRTETLCTELFVHESWDNPESLALRKKTHMREDIHYREKWQIALKLIDLAVADGVSLGAVVADSRYGNIMEFRRGLDERQRELNQVSSLPDVRRQIYLYLMRMPI